MTGLTCHQSGTQNVQQKPHCLYLQQQELFYRSSQWHTMAATLAQPGLGYWWWLNLIDYMKWPHWVTSHGQSKGICDTYWWNTIGGGCKRIANINNYATYIPTYICECIEHLRRMSNRQQGQSVIAHCFALIREFLLDHKVTECEELCNLTWWYLFK